MHCSALKPPCLSVCVSQQSPYFHRTVGSFGKYDRGVITAFHLLFHGIRSAGGMMCGALADIRASPAKKAAKTSFSLLPLSSLPSLLTIISPTTISTFFSQLLVTPVASSPSLSSSTPPAPVSFSSHQTSSNASGAVGKGQAGKCLPQCGNVSFLALVCFCAFALLHFCIFAHLILTPNPHC